MRAWVRWLLCGGFSLIFSVSVAAEDRLSDEPDEPVALTEEVVPSGFPTAPEISPRVSGKRQVTRFGQISVIGSHQNVRGGIASMVRRIHEELNDLCNQKGRQLEMPLIVRLYGAQGDKVPLRSVVSDIVQIQNQYQLNIRVHIARGVDWKKLRYHIMEMLLYERGLGKGQVVEEGERVLVKPWLVVGLLDTLDLRSGRGDRKLYQSQLSFFDMMPLQDVFDASEKETRSFHGRKLLAFRAISAALVSSLVRQPKGRPSLAAYLTDFATFKGESENLMRRHFPAMNKSRNSLEKWISLEMLELGTARLTEVFSILETEKRLKSILKLRYQDEKGKAKEEGIESYAEILKIKDVNKRVNSVAGMRAELERLSYRCFPTYRPLIAEYEVILREIVMGQDKKISARLTKLEESRLLSTKAAERVRDYLDWYYITQSNEVGGNFIQYRELNEALEKEAKRGGQGGVLENYLDFIQKVYGDSDDHRSQ